MSTMTFKKVIYYRDFFMLYVLLLIFIMTMIIKIIAMLDQQ